MVLMLKYNYFGNFSRLGHHLGAFFHRLGHSLMPSLDMTETRLVEI